MILQTFICDSTVKKIKLVKKKMVEDQIIDANALFGKV